MLQKAGRPSAGLVCTSSEQGRVIYFYIKTKVLLQFEITLNVLVSSLLFLGTGTQLSLNMRVVLFKSFYYLTLQTMHLEAEICLRSAGFINNLHPNHQTNRNYFYLLETQLQVGENVLFRLICFIN